LKEKEGGDGPMEFEKASSVRMYAKAVVAVMKEESEGL
jgi:hypothetical protein